MGIFLMQIPQACLYRWVMIEMGSLMKLSSQAVTPALMFLFKYLEKIWTSDNKSPTLMVLDEAWVYLANPVFERIRKLAIDFA